MNSRISTMISEKSKIAAYSMMPLRRTLYHVEEEKDYPHSVCSLSFHHKNLRCAYIQEEC